MLGDMRDWLPYMLSEYPLASILGSFDKDTDAVLALACLERCQGAKFTSQSHTYCIFAFACYPLPRLTREMPRRAIGVARWLLCACNPTPCKKLLEQHSCFELGAVYWFVRVWVCAFGRGH